MTEVFNSTNQEGNKITEINSNHFIEDKHYQAIKQLQEEIYKETQVKPSIRKLVNLIIGGMDHEKIRQMLIDQYR